MATVTRERELLRELVALVRGECPSLLNEDSGGDVRLSMAIDDALAAPPAEAGGAMSWQKQSKELALLLNSLVLSAIAKGAQSQYDVPIEDRITDADLERYESKIMDLAAALAAPPASDPPGLVEIVRKALPALVANRPPSGQMLYSQVREAIDALAAYPLPASPQAETTKEDE